MQFSVRTAMEGVLLEEACFLGVAKLTCSLFFLSTYPGLISFCFSSLLMFTDLLVTGFLLVLWFTDPLPPQLSPSRDLIALRFLLFLGNTYGAALLLSAPLVVAETALRRHTGALESSVAAEKGDPEASAERGERRRLGHAAGYLSCLAAWMASGLWAASVDQRPQELEVSVCLRVKRPLITCLPTMIPSPVKTCYAVALVSLALLLFLALELVAWVRRDSHDPGDGDSDNIHSNSDKKSSSWPQLAPSLGLTSPLTIELWLGAELEPRSVDPGKTSSSCPAPTEKQAAHRPDPVLPDPGSALADPGGGQNPPSQGSDRGPGLEQTLSSLGLAVTTGLIWMISLCLLPGTLSVNVPLIQTVQAVVAMCADNCLAPRWQGVAGASVLQSWRHYCGV